MTKMIMLEIILNAIFFTFCASTGSWVFFGVFLFIVVQVELVFKLFEK